MVALARRGRTSRGSHRQRTSHFLRPRSPGSGVVDIGLRWPFRNDDDAAAGHHPLLLAAAAPGAARHHHFAAGPTPGWAAVPQRAAHVRKGVEGGARGWQGRGRRRPQRAEGLHSLAGL
eukprot:352807-Chlamydomonas_euryale.AAC.4